MQVAGWIKLEYDLATEKPDEILVDVIGIGAGVVDRLAELKLPVRGINVSESPALKSNYMRLRDELWFKGREWLEKRDSNLADDDELVKELVATKYQVLDSGGKVKVESKRELKKRGFDSPNRADAFLLTLASDAVTASGAPSTRSNWNEPLKRTIKGIV
jgi:hypothetical protein